MIVIQVEMARVHRTLLSSAKRNRGKDSSREERARERERLQAVLSGKPVSYRFDRPSESFHVFRWTSMAMPDGSLCSLVRCLSTRKYINERLVRVWRSAHP